MEKTQSLTPEQKKEIESLTPAEAQQIMDLAGPNGEINDAKLELVSGGLSEKTKKILGYGAAALAAVATVAAAGYGIHRYRTGENQVIKPKTSEEEPGIELQDRGKTREHRKQQEYSASPYGTSPYWPGQSD